jgi:F-type H+-transporting ATPase subunit a
LKNRITERLFYIFLLAAFSLPLSGQEAPVSHTDSTAFDASTFILDHIADSHEWHILTKKNGEEVAIYLPVILYSKGKGLDFFSSKRLAGGKIYKGYKIQEEGDLKGKIFNVNESGEINEKSKPLDFSMTKTVIGMLAAALIGMWLFISLGRSYKKTGISHPKGIQSFLEPAVLFVRDDIAIPNIGEHHYEKYMP